MEAQILVTLHPHTFSSLVLILRAFGTSLFHSLFLLGEVPQVCI